MRTNRIEVILALIDAGLNPDAEPGMADEAEACIHGCPGECDDPTAGFLYPQD